MENNKSQVQPVHNELTDEQKKEQYKEFTITLVSCMTDLDIIQRSFCLVHRLFLNDTGAVLDTSPQGREKRQLLADINHYCGNMPIEQLTRIRNICNCIYNAQ